MKIRKTPVFIILLLMTAALNAQEFTFGLVAGFDIANARLTNQPEEMGKHRLYDPMPAFNVNAHVGYKSKSFWGINIEPGFIQKGGVVRTGTPGGSKDVKMISNYIQAPVLFNFYLTKNFFLSVGPEFAYMLNTKAKSDGKSEDTTGDYDHKFELSAMAGVNYTVLRFMDIGMRYNHGLIYTKTISFTNELGEHMGDAKVYNQYFQLFFRFKLVPGG